MSSPHGRQGVVFDLDGVLVMSEHLWEEAWERYSYRHLYAWTSEDTRRCQGMSVSEWAAYLAARTSRDTEDAARAVIAQVADAYVAGRVGLADGAAELVEEVAEHVPVALASSAPREIIDTVMRTTGIGACFSATVSSAEVLRGKPSPDVYLAAIERLGVEPDGSVAVEDSSNGVRAAFAAGLQVVAIPQSRYPLAADAAALASSIQSSLGGVKHEIIRILDLGPTGARP